MEASLSSKNVCKSHHCVSCCYGTEMLLLEADVHRIVGLGFKEGSFAVESDGFKMLRNGSSGRCVFHDGKQCTIYSNRPSGCKLYPIIFDEDLDHPVKDGLCPYRDEFDFSLKAKRELSGVYPKLIEERRRRHVGASLRAITSFEDDSTIGTDQEL
ncbi:MAG: YkgJ family cysteine cluster protein [Nitrososphaerales archaeon]